METDKQKPLGTLEQQALDEAIRISREVPIFVVGEEKKPKNLNTYDFNNLDAEDQASWAG